MNPIKANRAGTDHMAIDRILASDDQIVPSSGFLSSVMERIQEEAAAPPPIPFPWKRVVPGLSVAAGVLCAGAIELIHRGLPTVSTLPLTFPHISAVAERPLEQAGWVALALGASVLSWLLSRRLAGHSSLL